MLCIAMPLFYLLTLRFTQYQKKAPLPGLFALLTAATLSEANP
jgi:hypothetical protein